MKRKVINGSEIFQILGPVIRIWLFRLNPDPYLWGKKPNPDPSFKKIDPDPNMFINYRWSRGWI